MVRFTFIIEGMNVTKRPVLWSWIDLEVEGPSWSGAACHHHRTELVVIVGNYNAVRYREDILLPHVVPFLEAHHDMTIPLAVLLVLCVISCKTGMSVFCHGQRRSQCH